ncbi:hypothetical protein [Pseudomonas phage PPAT]|nr:hypothetical protein [Pseudomonas phage PPAT]
MINHNQEVRLSASDRHTSSATWTTYDNILSQPNVSLLVSYSVVVRAITLHENDIFIFNTVISQRPFSHFPSFFSRTKTTLSRSVHSTNLNAIGQVFYLEHFLAGIHAMHLFKVVNYVCTKLTLLSFPIVDSSVVVNEVH